MLVGRARARKGGDEVGVRRPPVRQPRRSLSAKAAVATALLAALPAAADARVSTHTARYGPIEMGGFNVRYPNVLLRPPRVNGYVVSMHAGLVDRRGRPVTIRDVMLHHAIFRRRVRRRARLECVSPKGEAFYSTGEENQTLRFPRGYGYRVRRTDRWRMSAMLMSHSLRTQSVYVRYRVTVDTDPLTPVQPFWLRAIGCHANTSYPVAGGGAPGAVDIKSFDWRVPYGGRIVAAGGHLHGGAKDMWLAQPGCGNRRVLDTRPRYAPATDLVYRLRPLLHEPGPIDSRYFLSRAGVPVAAGETLRLTAAYDDGRPHWAVMATMHVYLARDAGVARTCRPLPGDRRHIVKPRPARANPPEVRVPLTGLDAGGRRTATIMSPPWPLQPRADGDVVNVGPGRFSAPRISLPAGAQLTWRFPDRDRHDVTFANGPRALGTPKLSGGQSATARFSVPGRYQFFCSLHPLTMHQEVEVLPG